MNNQPSIALPWQMGRSIIGIHQTLHHIPDLFDAKATICRGALGQRLKGSAIPVAFVLGIEFEGNSLTHGSNMDLT
jgi:hypothetical protein